MPRCTRSWTRATGRTRSRSPALASSRPSWRSPPKTTRPTETQETQGRRDERHTGADQGRNIKAPAEQAVPDLHGCPAGDVLIQPVSALFHHGHGALWIAGGIAITVAFCVIYIPTILGVDRRPRL